LQSFFGEDLPLGDLGISNVDVFLAKLPREFAIDRSSGRGRPVTSFVRLFTHFLYMCVCVEFQSLNFQCGIFCSVLCSCMCILSDILPS